MSGNKKNFGPKFFRENGNGSIESTSQTKTQTKSIFLLNHFKASINRNYTIDLHYKSIDWFLYNRNVGCK